MKRVIITGPTYAETHFLTDPQYRAFLVVLAASEYLAGTRCYDPRVSISKDTSAEVPWHMRISSRVATALEKMKLIVVRVVETYPENYEKRADVTPLASRALDATHGLRAEVEAMVVVLREAQQKSSEDYAREHGRSA